MFGLHLLYCYIYLNKKKKNIYLSSVPKCKFEVLVTEYFHFLCAADWIGLECYASLSWILYLLHHWVYL